MSNVKNISLNTGKIRVNLTDEDGETMGVVSFVPSAVGFLERYEEIQKYFENRFGDEELTDEMTTDDIVKISGEIKEKFDYLLNTSSDPIFAKCAPLTQLADGSLYFVQVLDVIANLLVDVVDERSNKIAEAVEKYS